MKDQINDLLYKEMSRREFLATLGVGLASVMGLSAILKYVGPKPETHPRHSAGSYGTSAYGGSTSRN